MPSKKIFCIGLTKTGTTSFNSLCGALGLKARGFSKRLLLEYLETHSIGRSTRQALDDFDAFDDWPWPFLYPRLLSEFGDDGLFVLTRRKSPEAWLNSIKRFSLSTQKQGIRRLTYGTDFPHGFEEHYLRGYTTHLDEVRAHFKAQGALDRLVDIEIGDPSLSERICDHMGLSVSEVTIPKSNQTRHRPRIARKNLAAINRTLLGLGKAKITLEEAGFAPKLEKA